MAKAKRWLLDKGFETREDPQRTSEMTIVARLRQREIPVAYERQVARLLTLLNKGWVSAGKVEEYFIWPCVYVLSEAEVAGCWQPLAEGLPREDDDDGGKNGPPPGKKTKTSTKKSTTFKKMAASKFYTHFRLKDVIDRTQFITKVGQVKEFLLSLTRSVPWLSSSQRGTKVGLQKSLEWILEHGEWAAEMIERRNEKNNDDDKQNNNAKDADDNGANDKGASDRGASGKDANDKSAKDKDQTAKKSKTTKKPPFLPPSLAKPMCSGGPGIPMNAVQAVRVPSGELGDEDIKEEDLHMFIRSKEEVETVSKLLHDADDDTDDA